MPKKNQSEKLNESKNSKESQPSQTETKVSETDSKQSKEKNERTNETENWNPKTRLGKKVKEGIITDLDEIFQKGEKILESEIVDALLPDLETDLLLVGQAKGKFGGGKRRIFQQTQKKSSEGNKPRFTTCALAGNKNGFIGISFGKSKETVPARDKSIRKAKLNLIKIRRGCGSWECTCGNPHSIPFAVEGKCGSSKIKLMPAPKGKGLCIEKECAKILKMAGIRDIWSKTQGQTNTKKNLIKALVNALTQLSEVKIKTDHYQSMGLAEGKIKPEETQQKEDELEFIETIKHSDDNTEKQKTSKEKNHDETKEPAKKQENGQK